MARKLSAFSCNARGQRFVVLAGSDLFELGIFCRVRMYYLVVVRMSTCFNEALLAYQWLEKYSLVTSYFFTIEMCVFLGSGRNVRGPSVEK